MTTASAAPAASVGTAKQRRFIDAARPGLRRFAAPPARRFDDIKVEGERIEGMRGAFDASAQA